MGSLWNHSFKCIYTASVNKFPNHFEDIGSADEDRSVCSSDFHIEENASGLLDTARHSEARRNLRRQLENLEESEVDDVKAFQEIATMQLEQMKQLEKIAKQNAVQLKRVVD